MHPRTIGAGALFFLTPVTVIADTFNWTFQDRYVTASTPSTGQDVHAPDFAPFTGIVSLTDQLSRQAGARQASTLGTTHLSYAGRSEGSNWACFAKSYLRVRFTIADATDWGIYGSLLASGGGAHLVLRSLETASNLVDVRAGWNYGAPDSALLNYSGTLLPGGYQVDLFEDCGQGLTTCSFDLQIPEPSALLLLLGATAATLAARRVPGPRQA